MGCIRKLQLHTHPRESQHCLPRGLTPLPSPFGKGLCGGGSRGKQREVSTYTIEVKMAQGAVLDPRACQSILGKRSLASGWTHQKHQKLRKLIGYF